MPAFKKLFFAPFFLIAFAGAIFYLQPFFDSPVNSAFSLDLQSLTQMAILSGLILLSSFFFNLFASLSQDWKLVVPVSIIAGLISLVFIPAPMSYVMVVCISLVLLLTFTSLDRKLKTYITFQPTTLLVPTIRQLTTLIILTFAFAFFLNAQQYIKEKGFEVPDSLIDASLKFTNPSSIKVQGTKYYAQLPQLKPEEIEFLKKNPQLLEERGIDPSILDSLNSTPSPTQKSKPSGSGANTTSEPDSEEPNQEGSITDAFYKNLIKNQLDKMVEPYLQFIPPLLALLFFFGLQSLASIFSLFLSPLVAGIFYVLEQTEFITFKKEMREVKKMVV